MARWRLAAALAFVAGLAAGARGGDAPLGARTSNVILVTTDGLRWQEVFGGAEEALISKGDGGVPDPEGLRREFWRETPEARRAAMMPFLWSTIVPEGQLFGNAKRKSEAKVTNGRKFSYPGYNEIFTGAADPRINSNDKKPNANETVFGWLHARPEFRGKVAAFGSWDVFPFIINAKGRFPVNAGWEPVAEASPSDTQRILNRLVTDMHRPWDDDRDDTITFELAMEHLRRHKPRVLYIGLGQTDTFAHQRRYDLYLKGARRVDGQLRRLWAELQSLPEYRDTTSLIITTDHGRGDGRLWTDHGEKIDGAERIWIAVMGPDTPALGERSDAREVTQSQVAATLAALLGLDYKAEVQKAAPPIADAIRPAGPSK